MNATKFAGLAVSVWIAAVPAATTEHHAFASERRLDLVTMLAAQKTARQMLQSAHARISIVSGTSGVRQRRDAEWWHSGKNFRCVGTYFEEAPHQTPRLITRQEFGILKGKAKTLKLDPKPPSKTIKAEAWIDDRSTFLVCSLWGVGMWCVNNEFGRYYENEIIDPGIFTDVKVVEDDSKVRISAKMKHGNWYDIWLAPNWNYIVAKTAVRSASEPAKVVCSTEATKVTEVAPGVYFPTQAILKNFDFTVQFQTDFISANELIDEKSLEIRFPEDTLVDDMAAGVRYVTDANENPKSPPKPIRRAAHHSVPTVTLPAQIQTPQNRWLLWTLATLFVVGAAFGICRWWRRSKVPSSATGG